MGVIGWGDGAVPDGVRVAAEHLAAARLRWFDSHRWKVYELPAQWWICSECLLPIEATGARACTGRT